MQKQMVEFLLAIREDLHKQKQNTGRLIKKIDQVITKLESE